MTLFPRPALSPPRSGENRGRNCGKPRSVPQSPLRRLQGLALLESPCRAGTRLSFPAGRSPPGLAPPQGLPASSVEGFSPPPLACLVTVCPPTIHLAASDGPLDCDCTTASLTAPAAPFSRRDRLPSRGFPPTNPDQCEVATILTYDLAALVSGSGRRHRSLRALFEPSRPLPCGPASALFRRSASGSSCRP